MRGMAVFALALTGCVGSGAESSTVQPTVTKLCDGSDAAQLSLTVGWGNIRTTAHFLYGQPALIVDGHCDFWTAWGNSSVSFQELRRGHLDEATQQRVARELRVAELGNIGSDERIGADGPVEVLAGPAGRVECANECQSSERKVLLANARALLEELWAHGDPVSDRLSIAADEELSEASQGTPVDWPANSDIRSLAKARSGQSVSTGVVVDNQTRDEVRALRDQLGTSYFEVSSSSTLYSVVIRDELPKTLMDSALELQSTNTR